MARDAYRYRFKKDLTMTALCAILQAYGRDRARLWLQMNGVSVWPDWRSA